MNVLYKMDDTLSCMSDNQFFATMLLMMLLVVMLVVLGVWVYWAIEGWQERRNKGKDLAVPAAMQYSQRRLRDTRCI